MTSEDGLGNVRYKVLELLDDLSETTDAVSTDTISCLN